jgi:hypothetical protein
MDLTLKREENRADGIFSTCTDADGNTVAHCLEHSYDDGNGGWMPKLANGTYTCQRGPHRLHGMTADFITFEITNVPDFQGASVTGILYHWGNYNADSEGCVLVGEGIAQSTKGQMVTASKVAWQALMDLQVGLDTFQVTVTD